MCHLCGSCVGFKGLIELIGRRWDTAALESIPMNTEDQCLQIAFTASRTQSLGVRDWKDKECPTQQQEDFFLSTI